MLSKSSSLGPLDCYGQFALPCPMWLRYLLFYSDHTRSIGLGHGLVKAMLVKTKKQGLANGRGRMARKEWLIVDNASTAEMAQR